MGYVGKSKMVIKSEDPDAAEKYGFVPPPPEAPERTDKALADVAATQRLMVQSKRGRASTFLTGPGGVLESAPLGGARLGVDLLAGGGRGRPEPRARVRTLLGGG